MKNIAALLCLVLHCLPLSVQAAVLRLEAKGPHASLAALALAARDGDVIEIAAGDYYGEVAVWTQDALTIRALGGPVRLFANGRAAEAKAIFVIRGGAVKIEGIEFHGARVHDANGAGIRLERGRLTVLRCRFIDNQNGILTSNDSASELEVEDSEFADNGAGDGYSHNLYAGKIARLSVRGSWFHHARVGHLLKSRARLNHIYYNRLDDGDGGRASYELEFPVGGTALVVGNLIRQVFSSENSRMLAFGFEGYQHPENRLLLAFNTFVDESGQAIPFVDLARGQASLELLANLYVGSQAQAPAGERRKLARRQDFVAPDQGDWRLRHGSRFAASAPALAAWPAWASAPATRPDAAYRHPATREARSDWRDPGAFAREPKP